ncbi:MAG: sugar transferase [Acidimicrobiia bacterium]|nr:sugar transferase [Acidimicrobiia bacterium]
MEIYTNTETQARGSRGALAEPRLRRRVRIASAEAMHDRALRRWAGRALAGDVIAAVVAGIIAWLLRFGLEDAQLTSGRSYLVVGVVLVALWPVMLAFASAYDYRVSLFGVEEIRRVARAGVAMLAIVALAHFLFALNLSRGYVVFFLPGSFLLSAAWRWTLRVRTGAEQRRGVGRHQAVAVGPADELVRLCSQLMATANGPIDVIAVVCDDLEPGDAFPASLVGVERLDSRDGIVGFSERTGKRIDLLLRAGHPRPEEMWVLARRARDLGVGLAMAPSRSDATNAAFSYVPLGSTPLLMVETPSLTLVHRATKALFDRAVALLMVVAAFPLLAAIAFAILVRDGRPVLFRQTRVGRDGEFFRMTKFRTMVPDAEARLTGLAELNEAGGPLFKLRSDPRVTGTGFFLRRYSLDELPQLFDVLRGCMSIVGPRPPLPTEVATYDERTSRRLIVKPGMTGLWQVQGRSDLPWDEGVYLDLMYVDHWSPLLDIAILLRTLRAVVRPRGAC